MRGAGWGSGMRRGGLALLFAGVLPALTGCNFFVTQTNGNGTGSTGNSVYVLNATTQTVGGFAIGTGTLTVIPGSPFSLSYTPQTAVVSRNNGFLYIAGPGVVNSYTIAGDGSLTQVTCAGCTVVSNVVSLDVSPDGQWLFGLDLVSTTIDLWQLNTSTGAMTPQTPATYAVATGVTLSPKQVRVSPAGNFVIAALGTGGDVVFPFTTSTGAFSTTYQTLPTGSTQNSDNALAINSTGTAVYIARSGQTNGVLAYTIATSGVLTPIAGSPFATGTTPASVLLDNSGAYLYVGNRGAGTISGYTVGTTGALTAIAGSPFSSGTLVNSLGADSSGKYVLAASSGGSPDLVLYSFDAAVAGKLNSAATTATSTDPAGANVVALTH